MVELVPEELDEMTATLRKRRTQRREFGLPDPYLQVIESIALLESATENNQRQISAVSANMEAGFKEITVLLERQVTESRSELKSLSGEFARARQTNWPLLISIMGLLVIVVGGFYRISDLQTQVSMAPVVAMAEVSKRDREEIRKNIEIIRQDSEQTKTEQRILETKLRETETQIDAMSQGLSIQFSEQQRKNSELQNSLHDMNASMPSYPTGPFFHPNISNRDGNNHKP